MDKSYMAFHLGLVSLGGFAACPVFPGFMAFIFMPVLTSLTAFGLLTLKRSKRILALLVVISFLMGCALRLMPRDGSGGVGDAGILLFLITWIPCLHFLNKIRISEAQAAPRPEGQI